MNKSIEAFPIKKKGVYFNHCGISPLYTGALHAGHSFASDHSRLGLGVASKYASLLEKLHEAAAKFLRTDSKNISFIHNTAEGLSLLAEAFPFAKGDEIISYVHEYPSNHYPWLLQKRRGVKLVLLENTDLSTNAAAEERPCGWSWKELEEKITPRTRMIALSHVQFTSGFASDLPKLGKLCREKKIHLIVDAAQSMGCMSLFPEEWNISAAASSGWKWLLGPIGCGIFYTSPKLREELGFTMAGADLMQQGEDYLNHNWKPHLDGRRFEYSTVSYEFAAQLLACFEEIFNRYGIENIYKEIKGLQKVFIDAFIEVSQKKGKGNIDPSCFRPLLFSPENSSGILSFITKHKPLELAAKALEAGLYVSARGGYLRIGMHFYNTEEEARRAAEILAEIITRLDS